MQVFYEPGLVVPLTTSSWTMEFSQADVLTIHSYSEHNDFDVLNFSCNFFAIRVLYLCDVAQ